MEAKRASEVSAAIDEAARRKPGGAIAFDGDGTLWSGDIGEDFFDALLKHGLRDVAKDALSREAVEHGLDAGGTAKDIAHRIHQAYLVGRFPEERVCEIMTWAAAGMRRSEVDDFAASVLGEVGLEGRLHGEAISVLEHGRRAGIGVYLVSASPRAVVEQAARLVGIALENVVSAQEVCDQAGVVMCAVERPIPYGPGKVARLREGLGDRPLYAAFGDNAFDVPLLLSAEIRLAVRPKARLLERAAEVPGLAVLV